MEATPMTVELRWQTVNGKLDLLQERVETMERYGDLEGLIEGGLKDVVPEICRILLAARECAASAEAAAFSPSGMSEVRGANESGAREGAAGQDVARGDCV
jgi:hypothetical protein